SRAAAARISRSPTRGHPQLYGCAFKRRTSAEQTFSVPISRRPRAWRAQLRQSFSDGANQQYGRLSKGGSIVRTSIGDSWANISVDRAERHLRGATRRRHGSGG